ncbi:helix-turn-helix transcriptional regulator [Natrinema salaciae]|uniref:IclR helix-turn-helix domain-containing protein n=1 Tax=Natrinema salaciae TaxID=1186196 RepID=A0A1H9GWS8_9EURY|nr:helix-turn-helix domain-containing protein [Natrinema salaciae]SEQ54484.1 IclR helix-turn-helix domain-containing protein [Natrinema salaciae]
MVSTPQIEVRAGFESIHSTVSIETVLASTHRYDVTAVASEAIAPRIGDGSGGSLSWVQLLRATSFWESALIAVLFLLISALVGLRMADVLSDRSVELSSLPLGTAAAGSGTESDHAHATDQRAYESYLSPETPPTLLSDEGKVVRLLIANHGRIRQHRIAEETGWSKSKVSRICSQMHADGTIEKRSVGRENVITLTDRPSNGETESDAVENPVA